MQLKSLGNLSIATDAISKNANNFNLVSDAVKNLGTEYAATALLSSTLTDAEKVQILVNKGLSLEQANTALSTAALSTSQTTATASTLGLSTAFKGLWATLMANPLILVGAGIMASIAGFNAWKHSQDELAQATKSAAQEAQSASQSISDYAEKYKALHDELTNANTTEERQAEIKKELLSIQTELNDKYGDEYGRINLVTDAYKDQTEVIKGLNKAMAEQWLADNNKGIDIASRKMEKINSYRLGMNVSMYSDSGKSVREIAEKYKSEGRGIDFIDDEGSGTYTVILNANAEDAEKTINDFKMEIYNLKERFKDDSLVDDVLNTSNDASNSVDKLLDQYQEIYNQAKMYHIVDDSELSKGYDNAVRAVEAYNDALTSGDEDKIKETRADLEEVRNSIDLTSEKWKSYANIINDVFNQADTRIVDFRSSLESQDGKNLIDGIKGYTETELKSMADDGNINDAMDRLMESAKEYELSVEDVISVLKEMGVVIDETADKSSELPKSFSKQEMISAINGLSEGFEELDKIYKSISDKNPFDFKLLDDTKFKDTFSTLGKEYTDFIETIGKSPSDINKCKDAFNNLVTKWIDSTGILNHLDESNSKVTASMLKMMGVENADILVSQALVQRKADLAWQNEQVHASTADEIQAIAEECGVTGEAKDAFYAYYAQKLIAENAINTNGDIEALGKIIDALGLATSAWKTYYAAKREMEAMSKSENQYTNAAGQKYYRYTDENGVNHIASQLAYDQKQKSLESKQKALEAEWEAKFSKPTTAYSGGNKSNSSGSGRSSADKTKEIKEEFDWLQRLDDYYQKQHDLQSKIAEDESASYSERIAALKEMTNLDKQRMGSATQTASEYLNKWEEIKTQLDPKYIAKIMYGNISKEELKAEENTALADQIELIKQGIEYYDMWQEAEQKKLELQEDCTERLKEEVALEQELIQAQRELLQGEIDYAQAHIDYLEASGGVVTEGYYKEQIRLSKEISDTYEDEIENLREQQALVKDGSAEYYQLEADIADCEAAIIECKTEQAEWNEAIKRLPVERMQKYINMLKAIKQELEDFLDYQETIGKPTTKDQFQQLIDINQEQINKLQEQAIELQGLLGDYKYGSDKFNEVAEELSDIQNETANLVNEMQEYNNEILNIPIEKLQSVNEELERYSSILSDIMDDYNSTLNAVTNLIDEQIQGYEDLKTAADDALESQVEPLQETLDLLEKTNTAREKEIALEQAKYNLERARNQKTIAVVRDGKIEYESDIDAVRDAEQELQNAELDKIKYDIQTQIEQFEEHHDNLIKGYDEEIDRLTDISNKWKEIQENASKYADTLKADTTLGSNWQDKILSGNDDDIYQMFKNLYESTNQSIVQTDEQIASNERIAEMMQVFVDRFIDGSVTYEQALSGISELSASINQGYTSLEQLNGLMNLDGLSGMAEITTSMQGQINESVSMLAQYIDVAKVNNDAIAEYTSTWEEMSELIKEQLAALKKAAEELEEWVKNQKYKGYSSDGGDGGGNIDYTNHTSSGTVTSGMNGGTYSDTRSSDSVGGGSPSSANDDQDEDDGPGVYHEGIKNGLVGKNDKNREETLKEIATKDLKPNERYVKVELGEAILNLQQQNKLIKNFQNISTPTPYFVPVTQAQTLPNNVSRQGDINVEFSGDIVLQDVQKPDQLAEALHNQFPNILRQELSK